MWIFGLSAKRKKKHTIRSLIIYKNIEGSADFVAQRQAPDINGKGEFEISWYQWPNFPAKWSKLKKKKKFHCWLLQTNLGTKDKGEFSTRRFIFHKVGEVLLLMCWRLVGPCYSGVPNISVETFTYFNSFSHKTCLFWSTCINNTLCRCTFQQETFWRGAHRVCLLKNNNIYVTNQILVQVCRVAIEHDKLLSVWLHLKSLSAWLTLCCLIWEYILIQKHGWKCMQVLLLG